MNLKTALELGNDCGLERFGEAILNVKIHCGQLFSYSDIKNETLELKENINTFFKNNPKTSIDISILDALNIIKLDNN